MQNECYAVGTESSSDRVTIVAISILAISGDLVAIALGTDSITNPSAFHLPDFFGEYRQDFKQIPDDAIVRNVEDWRFGILVDGHDRL